MTERAEAAKQQTAHFRRFFTQFNQFLLGNVASLLLGLVTFPILTRMLTKEQYGIVGLVTTTLMFATCVAKAGLSDGIIRIYAEYREEEASRSVFSSTVLYQGVGIATVVVTLYIFLLPAFLRLFKLDNTYFASFAIMAGCLALRPINNIAVNLMRVTGKTLFLSLVTLSCKVLAVALSLSLFLLLSRSMAGYFSGIVLAELFGAVVLFQWFFRNFQVDHRLVSKALTKKLIMFGSPLLLTELSYTVLSYGDRFVVASLIGAESLGVYTVGYNLAMYLANIIVFPLSYAIVPAYVGIYQKQGLIKTREFLNKCLNYFLIAMIPVCFGFYALAENLFVVLASAKYQASAVFSPLILIANLMLGLNSIFNAGLYIKKKSTTILGVMVVAGAVNIVSNLLLVPLIGLMGAAVSTLLSCLLATGLTVYLSSKHLDFVVDLRGLSFHLAVSLIMVLVLRSVNLSHPLSNMILKVVIGFLIVAMGFLLREKALAAFVREYLLKR